jgi:hypothetical protein
MEEARSNKEWTTQNNYQHWVHMAQDEDNECKTNNTEY